MEKHAGNSLKEPKRGEWVASEDFARIVCLTPLVSIDLVVKDELNRLLVGKRVYEPAQGLWFVPGGRITKNETRAQAFERLTRLELGYARTIDSAEFLGAFDHIYSTNRLGLPGFGTHYVVLAYKMVVNATTMNLPRDQHLDYQWLTTDEILKDPEVHENTKVYVRPQ
jgi:colanic acid biosynthesis protein WcaH